MPLEKAPVGSAGFGRNVATEVKAGKPVKQAVAIAYEKAGERKDSINNAPIYEENGEFFFPKPGSKERFGPYASKAEATSAAAKAGLVADDDEAILGRADADRLPAHIKHHGIHIDTSFKKGSNGTEADYWVVQGSGGRFYSLEVAKEVAEGIAKRKARKDDAKADAKPNRADEMKKAENAVRHYKDKLEKAKKELASGSEYAKDWGRADVIAATKKLAEAEKALAELKARKDASDSRFDVAEVEKKWQIKGVSKNGNKFAFPIMAFNHGEAKKKAEAKIKPGDDIRDIVLIEGVAERNRAAEKAKSLFKSNPGMFGRKDDAKADALPPLARALAAADSMYAKALDSVHRKDAERDLPGAGTTEGNYGIDAERDLTGEGTADADARLSLPAAFNVLKGDGIGENASIDILQNMKSAGLIKYNDMSGNYVLQSELNKFIRKHGKR